MRDDSGFQFFQLRPANVTDVVVFTAVVRTVITNIYIANTTASDARARIFHDDDGTVLSTDTAIAYDILVAANTTVVFIATQSPGGIFVSPGGTIGIGSNTGNALNFTGYGVRQRRSKL